MKIKDYKEMTSKIPSFFGSRTKISEIRKMLTDNIPTGLQRAILTAQKKYGCEVKLIHYENSNANLLEFDLPKTDFDITEISGQIEVKLYRNIDANHKSIGKSIYIDVPAPQQS